jgi:hypothetical protein
LGLAETVALIRDFILIFLLLLALLVALGLYTKVSKLLGSARRTLESAEDIADALSSKIVGPAAAGSSLAFGAGKVAAFVVGLSNKKRKGGEDNGE